MLLTHSYSVPKNGTPSLTANYKIIQALMGYATISAYGALSTLSTTIICFVLRVNTGQIIQRSKMKQKLLFRGHCPLHARRALHRGFGPLRSGPDQARHLPEAPVSRPRKSVQSHTRGIPRAASYYCIPPPAVYVH